jgi:hypothetical protein
MLIALAVVVEIEHRVREGVRDTGVMQGLVGVRDVEVAFDQCSGELFGNVWAAAQPIAERRIFAPNVGLALHYRGSCRMRPRA